jgi:hypothetical protein
MQHITNTAAEMIVSSITIKRRQQLQGHCIMLHSAHVHVELHKPKHWKDGGHRLPRFEHRKSLTPDHGIPDCQACVPDAGVVCDSPLHSHTLPWQGTQHPHYQFLWPPADGPPSASPVVHTVCEMPVHWGSHLLLYTHDLQTVNISTGRVVNCWAWQQKCS